MKKAELLGMKHLTATANMVRIAREDGGCRREREVTTAYGYRYTVAYETCRYGRYFMAAVAGDTLKVAVFTRTRLQCGVVEPLYEVFVNRKEKSSLHMSRGKKSGGQQK